MIRLRIKDWDRHFENAASRKLKRLDWVAIPIKTDGEGYTALVDHPDGAAHLGAWYAIVEVAAKQTPRGVLPVGIPQDIGGICQSLSRMSRLSPNVFREVLPRLLEIGWIEEFLSNDSVSRKVGESANVLAESATTSAKSGATLQDITLQEHQHHQNGDMMPMPVLRDVLPVIKHALNPEGPIPPVSQSEYPLTMAEIRKHDAAVDEFFVIKLVQKCTQHILSHPTFPQEKAKKATQDRVMAAACKESFATGPTKHGTGLLLSRVPPILVSWGLEKPQ